MNWIEKFYDLLEENRVRHNLLSHMRSNSKETMIEVRSGKDLIIHITDVDYDNCFRKAYDDLELKIKWMNERLEKILNDYKDSIKEGA